MQKKVSLYYVYKILMEETNSDHRMSGDEVANELDRRYGLKLERKAVGRDIKALGEIFPGSIEITPSGSYMAERLFDDNEIRYLIDCVLGSKYINKNYAEGIIEKLHKLTNKFFKKHTKHVALIDSTARTGRADFFYNIELIDEAIDSDRKISYDFVKYGPDKKLNQVSSSATVSPYQLIMHNQKYYLICKNDRYQDMSYIKIDRLRNIKITDEVRVPITDVPGYKSGMDFTRVSTQMPYMFGDAPETIILKAKYAAVDEIIEWFGTGVDIKPESEDPDNKYNNIYKVTLKASPMAMELWCLQYGKLVEAVYPQNLRDKISEDVKNMSVKYGVI